MTLHLADKFTLPLETVDGKGPSLPIVILGSEHGDMPLEAGSGELVARMIVQDRVSALLDLAQFRKHEVQASGVLFA